MPVNYQQMHASNQEIIDFFQNEQVVADLLEQFNQVADDSDSDSDDSDYQEESDYEDSEISESDTESDEEDEKENVNPISQPTTPPTQIISIPRSFRGPPHPPQLIRQRNTNNDGITWYIQPIIRDTYEIHTPRQNQETNNREILGDLSNITIRSRRRLHFN